MKETELNRHNFDSYINNSQFPVLIDFYATWCGPCKHMKPIISKIAEEYSDNIRVGTINVDSEMELAAKYGILSVPTLLVFKNGELTAKGIGVKTEEQIMQLINERN